MTTPYSPYVRRSTAWVDVAGRQRITNLTGLTSTGVPATWAAIMACSNADYMNYWEGPVIPTPGEVPETSVPYLTSGYVLAIELLDTGGDLHRIFLPAPITADAGIRTNLLKPDRQTMDVGSARGTALAAVFQLELANPLTSDAITDITAGWVTHGDPTLDERLDVGGGFDLVRRCVEFIDAAGRIFTTILTSRAGAPVSMDNLRLLTTAVTLKFWEGPVVKNAAAAPVDAAYWSVADEAALRFQDSSGSITTLFVPAPKREIFRPDGKTVDETNALVAAVIAAALTETVVSTTNLPVVSYVGGLYHYDQLYAQ